ncbi:MAG: tetratricopeptide repeat protein [Kiritimatiellae bacterium]|nr:tetratricopeptide repeat protein [Kiritimatiellia bacterium]
MRPSRLYQLVLALGASVVAAQRPDELLRRAREAMRDQIWTVAARWFEQAWSNAPSDEIRVEAALGLADAQMELNAAAAAAQLEEKVPTAWRDAAAVWLRRAALRQRGGDEAGAREAIGRIRWDDLSASDRPRAVMIWSDLLWARGETDEALAALEFALPVLGPCAVTVARRLALRWREAGVPQRAVELLEGQLAAASPPEGWLIRLDLGGAYLDVGRTADAAEVMRPLIESEEGPRSMRASAWLLRAKAEASAGRANSADAAFEEARRLAEGSGTEGDILFELAAYRLHMDQLDSARELIRRGLQRHPRHRWGVELQLDLARRLRARGEAAAALEAFQAYLEMSEDPAGQAEALMGKGECLVALSRPLEAAAAFERAAVTLREPSARMAAELKRAEALAQAGRWAEALNVCEAFLRANPEHPAVGGTAVLAAECLAQLGREDEALQRLSAATTGPFAAAARLRRARLHERRRDWDAAERAYAELLELHPSAPEARWARLGLALLHYRRADGEAALRVLEPLGGRDAADEVAERAEVLRVWCHHLLGDEAAAVGVAQQFLQRWPRSPRATEVRLWLADLNWHRGRFEAAEREYVEVADLTRGRPPGDIARYRAARAAAAAGELSRALQHFQRLAEEHPGSPVLLEARFAQGDVLAEMGRFDAAVLSFDEVIRAAPDSTLATLAWGRKGDCHFTLGAQAPARYEQALTAYRVVADREREAVDVRLQAVYKAGRCEELLGRSAAAIERYLAVVYRHLEERAAGRPGAPVWFARAAFAAAALQERAELWQEAVQIYRRVVEDGGPASADAAAQIRRLLSQHPETQ